MGAAAAATGAVRGPRSASASAQVLTPKEVLGILRRHIILIVFMTFLGGAFGGTAWYLLRRYLPSYTAETYIEVLPPIQEDPTIISTTQVNKDVRYGYRVYLANLIRQQGTFDQLLKLDKIKKTSWFQDNMRADYTRAMKYLLKYFGAYGHRDADFVSLSMTCRLAQESADIVNAMAELFVKNQGGQEKDEISQRLVELEQRRSMIQQDIEKVDKALEKVRTDWSITDVGIEAGAYQHQHPIVQRFNQLQLEENELLLSVRQMQANIRSLEALATGHINEQIEHAIERDPVILSLAQHLAVQQANLSGRLAKFGENHRVVRQTRELITELEQKKERRNQEIAEQTRQANLQNAVQTLMVMQERLTELQRLREEAEAKKTDLDQARDEYRRRLDVRAERINMVNTIKEQIEKLRIMLNDPKTPRVQLTGMAQKPLEMTATRHWVLWFPSGTMLGFLFGIALTFMVEMLNDLVRTPSDVARFLNIPLLGIIPDDDEDDLPRGTDLYQVVRQAPYSILGEAYRRCRTNLELSGFKSCVLTSGEPGDGTSSCAVNLALSLTAKGKKVVLVDANFRQPVIQSLFPKTAQGQGENGSHFGLSSVLLEQCMLKDALRTSGMEKFHIIDTGLLPPNPAELLAGPRMKKVIQELTNVYDHVIVDTPPVLLVSDAKVLSQAVDATLLVFHAAGTRQGAAKRAIEELRSVNANIIGCVLFGARAMKGGYFREQFKSYKRYMRGQLAQASHT
jgi:capsular exopolysaccharide synthesis family protein